MRYRAQLANGKTNVRIKSMKEVFIQNQEAYPMVLQTHDGLIEESVVIFDSNIKVVNQLIEATQEARKEIYRLKDFIGKSCIVEVERVGDFLKIKSIGKSEVEWIEEDEINVDAILDEED